MRYFDHDTDASFDSKISALRFFHGGAAVDAYWCLVECIYKDEKPFETTDFNAASLAMKLNASLADVQKWIDGIVEVGLLRQGDDGLTSDRIEKNICSYRQKKEQSSRAGKASAEKRKQRKLSRKSTTVERPLNDRATNKIKENKEDVELLKAQQSSTRNGVGATEDAAAIADDGSSWDWDEVMRELMLNA